MTYAATEGALQLWSTGKYGMYCEDCYSRGYHIDWRLSRTQIPTFSLPQEVFIEAVAEFFKGLFQTLEPRKRAAKSMLRSVFGLDSAADLADDC